MMPVQANLRCANLHCNHEWTVKPDEVGTTTIGKCPQCAHSECVVTKMKVLQYDRCEATEIPPDYLQVGLGAKLDCYKVKGHAGAHTSGNGAFWGPMSSETVSQAAQRCAVPYRVSGHVAARCSRDYGHEGEHGASETVADPLRGFDVELERHRNQVRSQIRRSLESGTMRRDVDLLAEAVFFLLALAHQPEPGGVVEVDGRSPKRDYNADGEPIEMVEGTWRKVIP